jgi:hypothetical protein
LLGSPTAGSTGHTARDIGAARDAYADVDDRLALDGAFDTTTVVEVDGSVVFIGTGRWAGADSIQAEFDEIIESIRFE